MLDWRPFLTRWSKELLKTDLANQLSPPLNKKSPDWLGFPPASEKQIKALERRLHLPLPPSYKSFLLISNGWRRTTYAISRIRATKDVNWFRVENEADAKTSVAVPLYPDDEYFDYASDGAMDYRDDHLANALQISDYDDGVYLLNPRAVTPDGEWEAWFFANWVPGAVRFPSFAHLMVHQYRIFRKNQKVRTPSTDIPKLKIPNSSIPRVSAESLLPGFKPVAIQALLEEMGSSNARKRNTATRAFLAMLKGRAASKPRPALVEPLTTLFHAATDLNVRAACISGLTEFAPDRRHPPAPFLASVSDPEPAVVLAGIDALEHFFDIRAVEPLCRFIECQSDPQFKGKAIDALRHLGDDRALPTLQRVLFDSANTVEQLFSTAAIALAALGDKGFAVLEKALSHRDPRIRHAAVEGIDYSQDPRAAKLLYLTQEKDPDPNVRERARIRISKLFGKPRKQMF